MAWSLPQGVRDGPARVEERGDNQIRSARRLADCRTRGVRVSQPKHHTLEALDSVRANCRYRPNGGATPATSRSLAPFPTAAGLWLGMDGTLTLFTPNPSRPSQGPGR